MKLILMPFFVIALLTGRCTENTVQTIGDTVATDELIIRTGTSFGMCVGYCRNDYVFNGTSATLAQTSTRSQAQYPAKTCQSTLSPADWNAMKALAEFDSFSTKPETLGCPDCADGGAEYIELQTGERKRRVTFEFGKTIPGFESLVEALRKKRDAFRECK